MQLVERDQKEELALSLFLHYLRELLEKNSVFFCRFFYIVHATFFYDVLEDHQKMNEIPLAMDLLVLRYVLRGPLVAKKVLEKRQFVETYSMCEIGTVLGFMNVWHRYGSERLRRRL